MRVAFKETAAQGRRPAEKVSNHVERVFGKGGVPQEQLEVNDRPISYLSHHPVCHHLKPDKVRVVYDCAASNGRTSLNHQPLQRLDPTNQLTGVLIRFRVTLNGDGCGRGSNVSSSSSRTPRSRCLTVLLGADYRSLRRNKNIA